MRRCTLGPVYTLSPAQRVKKWFVEHLTKILWAIVLCIAWQFILYVFVGIINFVGGHVAEMWERETPTMEFYNHPWCVPFKIIGSIIILIYVVRDKTYKRK